MKIKGRTLRILIGVICLFYLLIFWVVGVIGYFYFDIMVLDQYREKQIAKDFQNEIYQTQGLKVIKFFTFDGDGWADLEVIDKGKVSLFYHGWHKFSLRNINGYSMTFPCVLLNRDSDKVGYGGEESIWLYAGSPYLKWFPQVDSLQDLVDKYDQVIKSLEKLPKDPELREYTDPIWKGKRVTLANPDEKFRIYHKPNYLLAPIYLLQKSNPFATRACDLFTVSQ